MSKTKKQFDVKALGAALAKKFPVKRVTGYGGWDGIAVIDIKHYKGMTIEVTVCDDGEYAPTAWVCLILKSGTTVFDSRVKPVRLRGKTVSEVAKRLDKDISLARAEAVIYR
jgi:hypothetical protein